MMEVWWRDRRDGRDVGDVGMVGRGGGDVCSPW